MKPEPSAAPRPGRAGEELACRFLEGEGYQILARNFSCRGGEVDVVARCGDITVFVEVKERSSGGHGEGFEAVTTGKRARVVRAAMLFASKHGLSERPLRFDVVSILRPADGAPQIRHDAGAFDADGF